MPPIDFYSCYVIEETDVPTRVFPSLNLFKKVAQNKCLNAPLKTVPDLFHPSFSFPVAVMPVTGPDDDVFRALPDIAV